MSFDLPAYLARVGLAEAPAADLAGLAAVQRAQRLAIAFENLDIPLGRGIAIDPQAVFAKLVTRARGGYCFEQNRLFRDALAAVGFDVRPLLARVWLAPEGVPGRTHTLNLVTIDGDLWIADAGFGGSFTPPLPLAEGAHAETADGAAHRLVRDPAHGWMLERNGDPHHTDGRGGGAGWQPQYSFTLETVYDADLAIANHWTSTEPGTRFTSLCVVSRVEPAGFAALTDGTFSRGGERREIGDAEEYRAVLSDVFGLALSEAEVAGLGLF